MQLSPLIISLQVACVATIITFFCGIAAARLVLKIKKGQNILDVLFTLPLVLPPTVMGFFLLLVFGTNNPLGQLLATFGIKVVFSLSGAIIAAATVSFPLMYRTARGAFEQLDINIIYAARTLGTSEQWIFWKLIVPLSWPGIIAGTILAFTRALGEFGATIMLAGNIPGKTQTMSVAIYTAVQAGNRQLAYQWVAIICIISLITILLMNYWSNYQKRRQQREVKL